MGRKNDFLVLAIKRRILNLGGKHDFLVSREKMRFFFEEKFDF